MNFYVMTLFPEMVMNGLSESITGRAMEKGLIDITAVNIRDFAQNKYKHVDDYIYGGGSGMLMQAEPVYLAYQDILRRIQEKPVCTDSGADSATETSKKPRVLYMSPQGRRFDQSMAKTFSQEDNLILLCGHYEGIDERVLEMIVDEEVSIGDYVLTGGELPAMTIIDAVSRLVPGVLGSDDSAVYETFYDGLVEYPQYTRPEEFMGRKVPEVLLSGHHKRIEEWRLMKSLERTKEKRPDLYEAYLKSHDTSTKQMRKIFLAMEEAQRYNQTADESATIN
jgi:tRNA (guanine37-N1)-methyltransferase